jgi:glycosyltransferase involved in cell wall biosynthesis
MKIFFISDGGVSSGFGRIDMEVNIRHDTRGYQIMGGSLYYDSLLPPTLDGRRLPYHEASFVGKDWLVSAQGIINAWQPDIVVVCQDAPYAEQLRNSPIDWSQRAFVVITPVDGVPIRSAWVDMLKGADGVLTISQFGVDAMRKAGIAADLCRPGVDANAFFPMNDAERTNLRHRLGIAADAFVVGTMAMNQGRKDIPDMLRGFFAFASDKPSARYLLDMEAQSPAGWDIPDVCKQQGWDASKLLFRADAARAGLVQMRERYNLLDAHMVIAHREGYGLPLAEAQACGVVSIALDYCSGTEICGDGKGILIEPIAHRSIGTWGGAEDCFPNVADITRSLQFLYDSPDERRAIAKRGMTWARAQTWDAAADAVANVYERVMAKRKQQMQPALPSMIQPPPPVQMQPDGVAREVELVEGVA